MSSLPFRVRRLALLGIVAVTAALFACGEDPDATTVASEAPASETSTSAVPDSAKTAASSTTVPVTSTVPQSEPPVAITDAGVDLDASTVWMDVFNTLTASEQSCVREEVDEELLESLLDQPVVESVDDPGEWAVSVFSCLAKQTARALFLAITIEGIETEAELDRELSDAEESCLRDRVAGIDVVGVIAATVDYDPEGLGQYFGGVFSCVPDAFLSIMFAWSGAESGDLGEGELSCLHEWMAGVDWSAFLLTDDIPVLLDEFLADLAGCGPTLSRLVSLYESPIDATAGPFGEATWVAVGEAVRGTVDYSGDVDVFVFEAVGGEFYEIDVVLGSLPDSVLVLYDADGWELAYSDDFEDSLGSRVFWEAPRSGSYFVEVAGWDDGTGSYTLTVDVR